MSLLDLFERESYWFMVLDDRGNFHHQKVRQGPGLKPVSRVKVNGHDYSFQPERAFRMNGPNPFRYYGFWTELLAFLDRRRKFILVYEEGIPDPIDRTVDVQILKEINPRLVKVLSKSKLYDDYLKRLNYGGGVSTLTLALVVLGVLGFVLILVMGGYL